MEYSHLKNRAINVVRYSNLKSCPYEEPSLSYLIIIKSIDSQLRLVPTNNNHLNYRGIKTALPINLQFELHLQHVSISIYFGEQSQWDHNQWIFYNILHVVELRGRDDIGKLC